MVVHKTHLILLISLCFLSFESSSGSPILKQERSVNDLQDNNETKHALYNPDLIEGDLVGNPDWSKISSWPNAIVPILLDGKFGGGEIVQIERSLQRIENISCILFRSKNDNDKAYVLFTHGNNSQCSSYLGYQGGPQEIQLGHPNCWTEGNIMHLLLHTLGLPHEHTRRDRYQVLRMTYRNVLPKAAPYFQIHQEQNIHYPYDYYSLMHYSRDAFSHNGRSTIYPRYILRGVSSRQALGQRVRMSPYDKIKLRHIYECKKKGKETRLTTKENAVESDKVENKADLEIVHDPIDADNFKDVVKVANNEFGVDIMEDPEDADSKKDGIDVVIVKDEPEVDNANDKNETEVVESMDENIETDNDNAKNVNHKDTRR